ncbi:MAG: PD40 domain-containing protein [Acidobacteria bacterium]|nr:PD40 domain-containing protein [Acidobacteriota bacterium]
MPPRIRVPEVTFGPFVFDPNRRLLSKAGVEVPLPPRVLGVLEVFLWRAGDVIARQELIDAVWKEAFVTDTSLAEAVSFLRQALGDDPQAPTFIQTVHRRGYRFLAAVYDVPAAPAALALPAPDVSLERTGAEAPVKPSIANDLLPWSIAILSFIAALSAIWYATRLEPEAQPVVRIPITLMPGWQFDPRAPGLAISARGSRVAWTACRSGNCELFVRDLAGPERSIERTDGAAAPFFSPDELWVGFFADGKLKKVLFGGGAPVTVAEAPQPNGGAWMPDGRIVFAASVAGGLQRVSDQGGEVEILTTPSVASGEIRHVFPSATPDGESLLFIAVTSPLTHAAGRLAVLPYSRGTTRASWRVLAEAADIGVAVGTEYVAFVREGGLHAVAFDRVRQATSGVGQIVETGVMSPHLATSASGALAIVGFYSPSPSTSLSSWSWSVGGSEHIGNQMPALREPTLSPDGLNVAGVGTEARPDIWALNLQRGTRTRLTYSGPSSSPVWSSDGTTILYATRRNAGYEIWARDALGKGDGRRVLASPDRHLFPASAATTGALAYVETGGSTRSDIAILKPGEAAGTLVGQTPFDEAAPALSPDGTLVAYQSDESGRWEVVLLRLTDARRTTISTTGGMRPRWGSDGRSLFFERNDLLMKARVTLTGDVEKSPERVVALAGAIVAGISQSGAALLHRPDSLGLRVDSGVITLQWIRELRRKLGPPTATSPR